MPIRRHRGSILVAVRRGDLPGAAADAAESPAALSQRWIAQATRTPFTGTVASSNTADRNYLVEHDVLLPIEVVRLIVIVADPTLH